MAAGSLLAATPAAHTVPQQEIVLVRHASVMPMEAGAPAILEDHAIVLRGDTILWVGPDAERPPAPAALEVDAAGKYVMPGLVDMHVHLSESHLPLFLANGVTTVREMNGSAAHLDMRRRVEAGVLAGPRLFVGSPLLTGQGWSVRHVIVPDPDSARSVARRLDADGYDWIKIYDGLSAGAYTALVETARERGLPITGHIPESVGLEGVLAAGQDLEHVEKIAWVAVGLSPDASRIPATVKAVSEAGVRLTATLWSQRIMMAQGTVEYDSLFDRPETRFMSEGTKAWWASLRRERPERMDTAGRAARIHDWQQELVRALHEAGVPVLLGTDTPNPLLVPGFSIHDEIAALIDAGIPVPDVLRAGTSAAGEALGMPGKLGVIREGARADLLILSDDPVLSPAIMRHPDAVIARGRLFRREALERMLAAAAPAVSRR